MAAAKLPDVTYNVDFEEKMKPFFVEHGETETSLCWGKLAFEAKGWTFKICEETFQVLSILQWHKHYLFNFAITNNPSSTNNKQRCAFTVTKHATQPKRSTWNVCVAMGKTPPSHPVHPIQDFSDNTPTALQDQREASPCQHECSDLSFLSSGAFPEPLLVSNILPDSLQAEM